MHYELTPQQQHMLWLVYGRRIATNVEMLNAFYERLDSSLN